MSPFLPPSQFDTLGNRTSLSATIAGTKDFFNSYGYDALSQLLSVTQMGQTGGNAVAPKGVGFAYNLDGQFTSVLRFDPTTASPHPDIALGTFSYDSAGRLASLAYTHLGNPIDSFGYQYDPLDRVSQFSSIDGTASYGYDKTSQLTSVVYAGGGHQPANESFQYDANGNQTGPSPAGPNFTVGTDNLLSSDGTFNLFYDAEGNLIEKKRISTAPANDYDTKQTWDYRNRLTDVWQYNNSGVLTKHEHLVYDPFDRLIGRFIDSTGSGVFDHTEMYVYDGSDVVLQFDGSGSLTNRYLNGPSPSGAEQVYAEEDVTSLTAIGAVTYPLTDQQGSPRDIVDSNSVLDDHFIFSAFGQTAFESNPAVHHLEGFAAGLPDPVTGEIHFGARNLDAVDAVWTEPDPTGFLAGDTNLRRDVGNDPTNYTDPTGLFKSKVHRAITRAGITSARLDFKPGVAQAIEDRVVNTDFDVRTATAAYHAQGPEFAQKLREIMINMKGGLCGVWHIGTALHIIQDFYSHTDWVEGKNMVPLYDMYRTLEDGKGKRRYSDEGEEALIESGSGHEPHPEQTLDLEKILEGDFSEVDDVDHYGGGYDPWATHPNSQHNRYAADNDEWGRTTMMPGSYKRATDLAERATAEFLNWAYDNMSQDCRDKLFEDPEKAFARKMPLLTDGSDSGPRSETEEEAFARKMPVDDGSPSGPGSETEEEAFARKMPVDDGSPSGPVTEP